MLLGVGAGWESNMSCVWRRYGAHGVLALAFLCLAAAPASAQWQIDAKDGSASIRFGFLAQPQGEWLETPDNNATSKNLFMRRLRLLFGGRVANKWLFFIDTDSPNLGKANPDKTANPTGAKDAGTIFIQDAYFTYDHSAGFKVEAGMILMALSHNHLQSAATLLPIDYGPYSFQESGPTGERVGRDYGAQLRGYVAGQKLEYRLGLFQGVRGVEAQNPFRVTGRVVYYPFGADTGFFYGGTWQGTRRMLGIGGFADGQKDYRSYGADVMFEEPFTNKSGGMTAQLNWMRFDGGALLPSLPKQDILLLEAAVHVAKGRVAPFVQYSNKNFENAALQEQDFLQVGLVWWIRGHNRNLKVGVGRQHTETLPDRTQVVAQLQVFSY
jgi:hypothetical protein